MRKTRVFIWGSCVSRDTFEHLIPEEFELLQYVARQSALSAYTRPVSMLAPPTFASQFQQRQVTGDFESSLRASLTAHAHDVDMLLVDLVDERLGIYLLPDGTVITRSVELIQSGLEEHLPEGTQHLPFGSPKHFEYWTDAIAAVGSIIRSTMPRAAVVLLDIPWAERSIDGRPTPDSFGIDAARANTLARPYIDVAVQTLGAHTIRLGPEEVTSSDRHPWGEAPFHYSENVYLDAVQRLTGAPGRIVWGNADTAPQMDPHEILVDTSGTEPTEDSFWRYETEDGKILAPSLRLNRDGSIWGFGSRAHKSEVRWRIQGDDLILSTRDGTATTTFPDWTQSVAARRAIGTSTAHTKTPIRVTLEATRMDWSTRPRPVNLTRKHFGAEIKKHRWKVGDHTYGKPVVSHAGRATLEIGKYCWFGDATRISLAERRVEAVSLYSFYTTRAYWPDGSQHKPETVAGGVSIGNDVRVEQNAVIRAGVRVGDGAHIREGAIVTEDVPPYAIIDGSPGRVVGHRFTEMQVSELLALQWWNWPDDQVNDALPIMSRGIEEFLRYARSRDSHPET